MIALELLGLLDIKLRPATKRTPPMRRNSKSLSIGEDKNTKYVVEGIQ
jgi:hypothetical protein